MYFNFWYLFENVEILLPPLAVTKQRGLFSRLWRSKKKCLCGKTKHVMCVWNIQLQLFNMCVHSCLWSSVHAWPSERDMHLLCRVCIKARLTWPLSPLWSPDTRPCPPQYKSFSCVVQNTKSCVDEPTQRHVYQNREDISEPKQIETVTDIFFHYCLLYFLFYYFLFFFWRLRGA